MESILSLIKVEEVADKVGACGAQQQHSHFGVDIDVVYVVLSVALAHNVAAALIPILVQLHQGIGAADGSMAIQGAQLFQGGRAVGVALVVTEALLLVIGPPVHDGLEHQRGAQIRIQHLEYVAIGVSLPDQLVLRQVAQIVLATREYLVYGGGEGP